MNILFALHLFTLSPGIPAVLITGDTAPEQFKAIISEGLPVLHKPLQSQVLQDMLHSLLADNFVDES